jgi:hypothetical protein
MNNSMDQHNYQYETILGWWYNQSIDCIDYTHERLERDALNDRNPEVFIDKNGHQWNFIILGPCSRAKLLFCIKKYRLEE